MSKLLSAVRRARAKRDAAEQAYRQALAEAYAEHPLREVGEAAGIAPTTVRYLLHPDPRKEQAR